MKAFLVLILVSAALAQNPGSLSTGVLQAVYTPVFGDPGDNWWEFALFGGKAQLNVLAYSLSPQQGGIFSFDATGKVSLDAFGWFCQRSCVLDDAAIVMNPPLPDIDPDCQLLSGSIIGGTLMMKDANGKYWPYHLTAGYYEQPWCSIVFPGGSASWLEAGKLRLKF